MGKSLFTQPDSVGTALRFTAALFYQSTLLSSRAEDAHQIYTRDSVLGEALKRNSEISPTPPLIFTGGQKVLNLASFSTSLFIELPSF